MRRWAVAILILLLLAMTASVRGWLGTNKPAAAIEYAAGSWLSDASTGILHDVVGSGDTTKWFDADVASLTSIIGYAHAGQIGLTQAQANARVTAIQIWGWLDTNGDGIANIADSQTGARTTKWVNLSELTPNSAPAGSFNPEAIFKPDIASYVGVFNDDGTIFYATNASTIKSYSVSSPYNLNTASSTPTGSGTVSAGTGATGLFFKPDGTKVYICDNSGDNIRQYGLSTPWDVTSIGSAEATKSLSAVDGGPQNIAFSDDGTKLFFCGVSTDSIYRYTLSSGWDLSTVSTNPDQSASVASEDMTPIGLSFKSDGTKVFVYGAESHDVFEYNLSSPWDLTTISAVSASYDFGSGVSKTFGLCIDDNGEHLYLSSADDQATYQFPLSTAWDITSVTQTSSNVVGWEVATSAPDTTSAWADILQTANGGTAIPLSAGQSWLLLIRAVATNGDTNLMNAAGGAESWENGDTSDGIGSDDPADVYGLGADGSADIADAAIVWVYVRRVGVTLLGRRYERTIIIPMERRG